MKKIFAVSLALLLALGLFGLVMSSPANAACEPKVVTLYAGQTIDVGTVTVSNDANNLYVEFETTGDWWLQATHLHVADSLTGVPTAKNGNPIPGQFDYQTTHDPYVQTYTYEIPISAIEDFDPEVSGSLVVAAHAALVRIVDGEVVQTETGWGNGPRFVDRGNWATYIEYEWQECNGGPGEYEKLGTAYAFGGDYATCFLDLNLEGQTFNTWGWTNGPLAEGDYEFELWAGAAFCDLTKGTLVGSVTVSYSGGTATVTYNMNDPYRLGETQLHVGSEPLARNVNNEYTTAPGQFGNIHAPLNMVASDSFTVSGLSGDIYVVAHASVYQPAQ